LRFAVSLSHTPQHRSYKIVLGWISEALTSVCPTDSHHPARDRIGGERFGSIGDVSSQRIRRTGQVATPLQEVCGGAPIRSPAVLGDCRRDVLVNLFFHGQGAEIWSR